MDELALSIPLEPYKDAELDLPQPMTEANWQQFMAVLEAMKPGLVRDEESHEAQESA